MDFRLVTTTLLREFNTQDINYAMIGGFALGFWGVTRATIDMDFLLLLNDSTRAEKILIEHGYRCNHKNENVAQYVSDSAPYGSIEMLFAFQEISRNMLARSVVVDIMENVTVKSLVPEDIIGLKLQALVNDPTREAKDLSDIEALLSAKKHRGNNIDWEILVEYFDLFQRNDLLNDLRHKYDEID